MGNQTPRRERSVGVIVGCVLAAAAFGLVRLGHGRQAHDFGLEAVVVADRQMGQRACASVQEGVEPVSIGLREVRQDMRLNRVLVTGMANAKPGASPNNLDLEAANLLVNLN